MIRSLTSRQGRVGKLFSSILTSPTRSMRIEALKALEAKELTPDQLLSRAA